MSFHRLKLLSANIQAGSSTRRYSDYATRSWSHVLPLGGKRNALDTIAELAGQHDIVGLQEADPGSFRSGFTNQTHYLANRAGFAHWSHQPNRNVGGVASSANGLLSQLEPLEIQNHALPGLMKGRGLLLGRFGKGEAGLVIAVAHLSLGMQSRLLQLAFIADILRRYEHAVLMGDFNCRIDQPEMDVLFRRTGLEPPDTDVPTFPAWAPERAIDHILTTGNIQAHSRRAVPAAASDHLALSVELDIPARALER